MINKIKSKIKKYFWISAGEVAVSKAAGLSIVGPNLWRLDAFGFLLVGRAHKACFVMGVLVWVLK